MSRYIIQVITFYLTLSLVLILTLNSCDNNPVIPKDPEFSFSAEDATCIEAWLSLKTTAAYNVNLFRNDSLIMTIKTTAGTDTIIFDEGLLPSKNYTYKAEVRVGSRISYKETKLRTLDVTSDNFSWQTWTFGGGGEASYITDVAIIDENNIWAVGEVYLPDSLGNPDEKLYNVLHWNGSSWKPKRISTEFRGNIITLPLEGALAFSANDIWLIGSLPIKGDGTNWKLFDIRTTTDPKLSVSKAWGTSSSNIYFVGEGGSIAYYNGHAFTKIESGTSTLINDIWGFINNKNETIAYAPVSSFFTLGDMKILKIKDNKIDSVSWGKNKILNSAWTNRENYLYVCGSGVYENKTGAWKEISFPPISTTGVRGNNINDIFICGSFGFVTHYNGLGWVIYNDLQNYYVDYSGVCIKENIVALVGRINGHGIITVGRRN